MVPWKPEDRKAKDGLYGHGVTRRSNLYPSKKKKDPLVGRELVRKKKQGKEWSGGREGGGDIIVRMTPGGIQGLRGRKNLGRRSFRLIFLVCQETMAKTQ